MVSTAGIRETVPTLLHERRWDVVYSLFARCIKAIKSLS